MDAKSLTRRHLFRAGAAAGTLSVIAASGRAPAAAAPMKPSAPLEGTLIGWAVVDGTGGLRLRLANQDAAGRVIGQTDWIAPQQPAPARDLRDAMRQAEAVAVNTVAQSWAVPPATCRVEGGRIVQKSGGRSIGYIAWVDAA